MRVKRLLALLLAATTLCTLLVFPVAAVPATTTSVPFTDIPEPTMQEAAEILRLLAIVDGTGAGTYEPAKNLTRAQFCKMAVELMGNGSKVAAQEARTIFQDVGPTHWARGYIAVATEGSTSGTGDTLVTTPGIIRGDPSGNFYPDRAITFAQAITILVRILGYSDADVGIRWPEAYLSTAKTIGVSEGIDLTRDDAVTRGQAALLLSNTLFTEPKGGKTEFLTTLGASITETPELVMSVSAGGDKSDITTAEGKSYKTNRPAFEESLVGRKATFVLDGKSKVLSVRTDKEGSFQVVNLVPGDYNYIKTSDGKQIKVEKNAKVYQNGAETTYDKIYQNGIRSGVQALLQYNAVGELEYIFLKETSTKTSAMVAMNVPTGNPFSSLTAGKTGYKIYKNGIPATVQDLKQYDVAVFDEGANVLYVSDLRLTGVYENAAPSRENPATVTMMGKAFPVLDSAVDSLAAFKLGDTFTLLLTYNGQVAGAVSSALAKSTTVGIASITEKGIATVAPLFDMRDSAGEAIAFTGETGYKGTAAAEMTGQLVTVSSNKAGWLSLSKLTGAGATAPFSPATGKIGSVALAENVRFYERVGTSKASEIKLEQITVSRVPADKIQYIHKDYAGNADIVVLSDVTGDQHQYGFVTYTPAKNIAGDEDNLGGYINATVSVRNQDNRTGTTPLISGNLAKTEGFGGVVASIAGGKLASYVALIEVKDVKSSDFDMDALTVTTSKGVFPISKFVQCYNDTAANWFEVDKDGDPIDGLNAARAFAKTLTLYYDKLPQDGGKIRLVVAE